MTDENPTLTADPENPEKLQNRLAEIERIYGDLLGEIDSLEASFEDKEQTNQ